MFVNFLTYYYGYILGQRIDQRYGIICRQSKSIHLKYYSNPHENSNTQQIEGNGSIIK